MGRKTRSMMAMNQIFFRRSYMDRLYTDRRGERYGSTNFNECAKRESINSGWHLKNQRKSIIGAKEAGNFGLLQHCCKLKI